MTDKFRKIFYSSPEFFYANYIISLAPRKQTIDVKAAGSQTLALFLIRESRLFR